MEWEYWGTTELAEGPRYSRALSNHQQHEVQQRKMPDAVRGTEQCQMQAQSGRWVSGEQLSGKGPGGAGQQ